MSACSGLMYSSYINFPFLHIFIVTKNWRDSIRCAFTWYWRTNICRDIVAELIFTLSSLVSPSSILYFTRKYQMFINKNHSDRHSFPTNSNKIRIFSIYEQLDEWSPSNSWYTSKYSYLNCKRDTVAAGVNEYLKSRLIIMP